MVAKEVKSIKYEVFIRGNPGNIHRQKNKGFSRYKTFYFSALNLF